MRLSQIKFRASRLLATEGVKQTEGEGHTENDKAGIENAQKVCMHEEDCKKSNRKHLAARGIF